MEEDEVKLIRGEWVRLPHNAVMGGEFFLLTETGECPTIKNMKTRFEHTDTPAANQPQGTGTD